MNRFRAPATKNHELLIAPRWVKKSIKSVHEAPKNLSVVNDVPFAEKCFPRAASRASKKAEKREKKRDEKREEKRNEENHKINEQRGRKEGRGIIGRVTSLFGPTRVVLHKKEVNTPRVGVPVQSSTGLSRHVDVVRGVHRHSITIVF